MHFWIPLPVRMSNMHRNYVPNILVGIFLFGRTCCFQIFCSVRPSSVGRHNSCSIYFIIVIFVPLPLESSTKLKVPLPSRQRRIPPYPPPCRHRRASSSCHGASSRSRYPRPNPNGRNTSPYRPNQNPSSHVPTCRICLMTSWHMPLLSSCRIPIALYTPSAASSSYHRYPSPFASWPSATPYGSVSALRDGRPRSALPPVSPALRPRPRRIPPIRPLPS